MTSRRKTSATLIHTVVFVITVRVQYLCSTVKLRYEHSNVDDVVNTALAGESLEI